MFQIFNKRIILKNIAWYGDEPTKIVVDVFNKGIIQFDDNVLDIGSGFGRNSNWLAGKGVNVTAVEIDKEEIKESIEKAKKLGVYVNYIMANAIKLPFSDSVFDTILDLGCTHMIADKSDQVSAEFEEARVLKPGGYLIYFGFSKKHPDYKNKPNSSMFRDLEDIKVLYGGDFEIVSCEENRWKVKSDENRNFNEHVGLNIIMKKKVSF